LLAGGLTTTGITRDEDDFAYKLFGGYQFNRNFALEGGYFNLGKFGFTSTTSPSGTLVGDIKIHGVNLDAVGTLPITERWSALGRVGAQYAHTRDSFVGTGAVTVLNPSPSKRRIDYKFGGGVQYEINRMLLLRLEAERYRINDAVGNHGGINMLSLGLVFTLGREAKAAPVAMAAPLYMEPPGAGPAPVVVAAAAPPEAPIPMAVVPARKSVAFTAETLFTFDQSELRPEGKRALDQFARELKGTDFVVVTVVGYTDRLGTEVHNQKLSNQRADVVKGYLVNTAKLDPAKISAVGKSETSPVTKSADCKDVKRGARLVECLQPDRRVEIDVFGTR
jgi:OOP family OmpA-OmpF porin